MKLTEMRTDDYLALLASSEPAPGGGSASALTGAQGAGLAAMVASLTLGKKKYEADFDLCAAAAQRGRALALALTAQIDADTEAFNLVSAAFRMPKETDEEKAARREAIAAATVTATEAPFETLRLCLEAARLASSLNGHSNANCASDLGVAGLSLAAAAQGAWLNILINLPGIKDEALAARLRAEGEAMVHECVALSAALYAAIAGSLS